MNETYLSFPVKQNKKADGSITYSAGNNERMETLERDTMRGLEIAIEAYWVDYENS